MRPSTFARQLPLPRRSRPVGMAAVTPGADERFDVDLGSGSRLAVHVEGRAVRTVSDRVKRFEKVHGKVADVPLDKLAQYTSRELKKRIEGAALVLVRSTEIDADGESDQLAASWGSFDSTLNVLQTAVARLLHAGIRRVVLTADHGFLAVRQVGEELKVDKPSTGTGELHRRAWIGTGGTATDSTVKVPLSDFGIGGGLDIIAPRGLGVFVAGGGLQFFHGGLSPQELVVPVITVVSDEPTAEPKYEIDLSVAGGRITTGIVAVTIQMTGDLFTRESGVRVVLSQDGNRDRSSGRRRRVRSVHRHHRCGGRQEPGDHHADLGEPRRRFRGQTRSARRIDRHPLGRCC